MTEADTTKGKGASRGTVRRSDPWAHLAAAAIRQAVRDAALTGPAGDAAARWIEKCADGSLYDPLWELAGVTDGRMRKIAASTGEARIRAEKRAILMAVRRAVQRRLGCRNPPDDPRLRGISPDEYRIMYKREYQRAYQRLWKRAHREKVNAEALARYYRKKAEGSAASHRESIEEEEQND